MSQRPKTLYEEIRDKGYSRRDFLKFCGTMAAMLGLESSGVAQVARALETKSRIPVLGCISRSVPAAVNHLSGHPIRSLQT